MNLKGIIQFIERIPGLKRGVQGTYVKGEYMPEDEPKFWVHVKHGEDFEVGREAILKHFPDRKRITETLLDLFKGKDADIFGKK